ncbi:MAG: hypothetical protein WAU01_06995, partial [Saprospiraceae bacterium]
KKIVSITQKISPEFKDNIMSTYDQLIQKGIQKGKLEGKIEGKLELVLNAFDNDLSISLISNITKLEEEEVLRILKQRGKIK